MMNKRGEIEQNQLIYWVIAILFIIIAISALIFLNRLNNTAVDLAGLGSIDTIKTSCNTAVLQQGTSEYCDKVRKAEFSDGKVIFGSCYNLQAHITGVNSLDCVDNLKKCSDLSGVWSASVCGKKGTTVELLSKDIKAKVENSEGHDIKKEYCCVKSGCTGKILQCADRGKDSCSKDGLCNWNENTINGINSNPSCINLVVSLLVVKECSDITYNTIEKCQLLTSLGCVWVA